MPKFISKPQINSHSSFVDALGHVGAGSSEQSELPIKFIPSWVKQGDPLSSYLVLMWSMGVLSEIYFMTLFFCVCVPFDGYFFF